MTKKSKKTEVRAGEPDGITRVFFVGAGLSAGLHYPIGRDLMPRLIDYLENKPHSALKKTGFENSVHAFKDAPARANEIRDVIASVLQRYFATDLVNVGTLDVAEFFTFAQMLAESPWLLEQAEVGTANGPNGPIRQAVNAGEVEPSQLTLFNDLAAITRSYFTDIGQSVETTDDIVSLMRMLDPKHDAIVNFNWDEEIELGLDRVGKDVCYTCGSWREDKGVLALRPHGSVGWYDVAQGIGNDDVYYVAEGDASIARYRRKIVSYSENGLPIDVDGTTPHSPLACPPVITAPTFAKRFDYSEQHRIWQDTLKVCAQAKEFVFLGYSLPKDDFLTRAAIRSALNKSVNKSALRCLVVDRSLDDAKLLNFQSVFEGFTRRRNYLQWEFGSNGDLAKCMKAKLRRANLLVDLAN